MGTGGTFDMIFFGAALQTDDLGRWSSELELSSTVEFFYD
jgi:hypothetical protein